MFKKVLSMFRSSQLPPNVPGGTSDGQPMMPACDQSGIIWTRLTTGGGGLSMSGGDVTTDNVVTTGIVGLDTRSFLYGFDGATFDRLRTLADDGDAQAALTLGLLANAARLQAFNGATYDRVRSGGNNADAEAVATLGLLRNNNYANNFNEVSWDRNRGNTQFTVLPLAARTATVTSGDLINYNARGIVAILNITAVPGVDTIQLLFLEVDPVSGTSLFQIGTNPVQIATGVFSFAMYPAAMAGRTNQTNAILPRTFRIRITHSGAGSFTYSVGASLIL